MPELRHLRVFLAVADELHFTRAAERLFLAQPAVSKAVAQLERELGVDLLERTTREVRLTAAGETLQADAQVVVDAADAAFARAREHGAGLAGEIAIGVTGAVGPATRRDATRRLREVAPDLSVALRELRPREIAAFLTERRVDVVLARTIRRAEGLQATSLAPTPAALLVPATSPLATASAPVELAALDGLRLLTWSAPGTPYTDLLVALCAAAGARVTPAETAVTGGADLVELDGDDLVAIVPAGWSPPPGTAAVELAGDVTLPLLAIRRAGPASPAVERLIALLGDR